MVELLESLHIPILGIVDRAKPRDPICERYPYLGDDEAMMNADFTKGSNRVLITPDEPKVRKILTDDYEAKGFECIQVLGGEVSANSSIGSGSVVQKLAFVSAQCRLGRGVKVNVGAKVMHDCILGDFVTIGPSAVVLGRVEIGEGAYIGANATLLPSVKIGMGATVGAGAVVVEDVAPDSVVKGVPAK